MSPAQQPAVWFPTVRTGTGTDVFTERLARELLKRDIRAEITWLPLRAEYAPWTVSVPRAPEWATVAHVNTWLHSRFVPGHMPVVATIHHSVHHPDAAAYKGLTRAAYHRFWIAPNERRILRRADRVIAVSRFVAETARQTLLDVPMNVIHNGVDTEKFHPGIRQRRPGEPFRLLYVGGWKVLKGVELLAPIMRELGDGFELRYTGGEAAERDRSGMPANMHDIGRLRNEDEVVAAMQDADALLFPSRSEGFGLVAAEAMCCGLPVIATRGSSLVEVVEDRVTGMLCSPDAVEQFVVLIRQLATDETLRVAMAQRARGQAQDNLADVGMVDAYMQVYHEVGM